MNFVKMSIQITDDLYNWLKSHSEKMGESMNTIIRRALQEYKNKL